MRKFFLHIGYHKTATTSLQDDLYCKLTSLKYIGKCSSWEGGDRDLHSQFVYLVCNASETCFLKEAEAFKANLDLYVGQSQNALLSEELLLGEEYDFFAGRMSLESRLSRISLLLEGFDLRFILTVRFQPDAIHSLYVQKKPYFYGKFRQFKDFYTDPVIKRIYNYSEILRLIEERSAHYIFIDFESIKTGDFEERLANFMGVDFSGFSIKDRNSKKMVNGKKVVARVSFRDLMKKALGESTIRFVANKPFARRIFQPIWDFLAKQNIGAQLVEGISQEDRDAIIGLYQSSNEIFYKKTGISFF